MSVYLLHFSEPYHHAKHYLGFAEDSIASRIERHKAGQGANLTRVVTEAGIDLQLARVWPDADRHEERRLKNMKSTPQYCPICRRGAEPLDPKNFN
jgi:hypothetical protein